jgi:hypothetical protein
MINHDDFTKDNSRYELTYLEPDTDDEITVTISDKDYRLEMSERIKRRHFFTSRLEKLTREMMLSAGRFTASVLHDSEEAAIQLDNIEKNIKSIRCLLI